jgi:hypothetical protein
MIEFIRTQVPVSPDCAWATDALVQAMIKAELGKDSYLRKRLKPLVAKGLLREIDERPKRYYQGPKIASSSIDATFDQEDEDDDTEA